MDTPQHQPEPPDDTSLHSDSMPDPEPEDARKALQTIRRNMEQVAQEFSDGKISRAQFSAIYAHYSEKRTVVEKLIERNADSTALQAAAAPGRTTFLRNRFEARPLYYLVFTHGDKTPLLRDGKQPPNTAEQIYRLLKVLWAMKTPRVGLARKSMGNGLWLVMVLGERAFTLVIYSLQPSTMQTNYVRDLHDDFERANRMALQRGLSADTMVFPQRALLENSL